MIIARVAAASILKQTPPTEMPRALGCKSGLGNERDEQMIPQKGVAMKQTENHL
jgi:hypothetical protein